MITEHDLAEAIAECEGQRNPTSNTCMKLAAFYTIRDKMYPAKQEVESAMPVQSQYSMSAGPINADTEFLQVISEMDPEDYLPIMDELMSTIETIIPRLYNGVMRKLTQR